MCELFGVSSKSKIKCNNLLETFFSHSDDHCHGWGLATFENGVSVEKEPVAAWKSDYLKRRMTVDIEEKTLIAHIRKASRGSLEYRNSHPFVMRDSSRRTWTLAHNGTMFECAALDKFVSVQTGATDSERILYYLIEQMDDKIREMHRELTAEERFAVFDEVIHAITPKNKVNLLVYDGDIFYVHVNHQGSLHRLVKEDGVIFSTTALTEEAWEPVPMNQLLGYCEGRLIYEGKVHHNEYVKSKYLFAGGGDVASCLGGYMATMGNDVTLLAEGEHLQTIQNRGLRMETLTRGTLAVRSMKASRMDTYEGRPDVVFFSGAEDVDGGDISEIRRIVGEKTIIVALSDEVAVCEKLHSEFPAHLVVRGHIDVSGQLSAPGFVTMKEDEIKVTLQVEEACKDNPLVTQMEKDLRESKVEVFSV